eukprot:scaffold25402_cov44-Phaeocystis_antarctica.AAC.4
MPPPCCGTMPPPCCCGTIPGPCGGIGGPGGRGGIGGPPGPLCVIGIPCGRWPIAGAPCGRCPIGHSRRGRPCGFDEALPGEHGQQPCGGLVGRAGGAVVDSARRPTAHWSLGRRHAQLRGVTLLVCVAAGVGRIDGVCGHVAPLCPGHADWGIVFHLGRPFGGRFCCLGEHDHCAPKRTLLALEFGAAGPSSRALVVLAHDANALPQPRGLLPDGAERLHLLLRVRLHASLRGPVSLFGKALAAARRAFLKSRSTGSSQRNWF